MRSAFLIVSAICLGFGIGYLVIFVMADTGDGNLLELGRLLCISSAGFFFAVIFGLFHIAINQELPDERNNPKR